MLRDAISSGACDGLVAIIIYRLTACRCDDSCSLASRVRVCLSRGRHGWGATSPLPLSNFNGQPVSPSSPYGQQHAFFGCATIYSQRGAYDIDLYLAASSISNTGSAILATVATIFRTEKPHTKCPAGMMSVGCGVDEDRSAGDLHPPKSIGCHWLLA